MHSSTISTILTLLLTYLTFSLPGFAQSTPLSGPRDTTVTSTSAETAQAVGAPCDTFGSYACANIDNTGSILICNVSHVYVVAAVCGQGQKCARLKVNLVPYCINRD
ncbi:hypothetical protein DL95DRAFT_519247 [Leptodontidium sp. 2 PMI_412]|nr:hypothetical protein BKA61DRAFT_579242 [Leptodontidium sp. MPI-SDFR-AT-0119]KAH9221707.1 hypothetical protein DL95DRAFT_519247 [Leptodontidium sp. 2 PMI_412]